MAKREEDPKLRALQESRSLNVHPERVRDEGFVSAPFFDARDVVQVKYEMVRKVECDRATVSAAAAAFGLSRPSYYAAAAALAGAGLPGLVGAKPGPKRAHKLNDEVCAFLDEALAGEPQLRAGDLVDRVEQHFGVHVHPRSIERALARYRVAKGSSKSR
jgi:transposase